MGVGTFERENYVETDKLGKVSLLILKVVPMMVSLIRTIDDLCIYKPFIEVKGLHNIKEPKAKQGGRRRSSWGVKYLMLMLIL